MKRAHADRDADIYAKQKAGKLRGSAMEYDLSRESIRRIECQEWRREQNPDRVPVRMKNGMLNAVARIAHGDGPGPRAIMTGTTNFMQPLRVIQDAPPSKWRHSAAKPSKAHPASARKS